MAPRRTGDSSLRNYLDRIGRHQLLSREEERELAERYRDSGDKEARERLILSNLRLVVNIAKRFQGRGLTLMDLIEEGNLGLLRAVDRYDPNRGARFSTLATWWIERAIRRALYASVRTVRIPAYMFEIVARAKHTAIELEEELSRPPSIEEIALKMRLNKRTALLLTRAMHARTQSLSAPIAGSPEDTDATLEAVLEDPKVERPEDVVLGAMELAALRRMIESIDRREARILALRFGLDHHQPKTLTEIGAIVGLSRERVRQIESRALKRLKSALDSGDVPPDG